MKIYRALVMAVILAPLLLTAARLQAAPEYTITKLSSDGLASISAWGINDSGQAVGYVKSGSTVGGPALFENGDFQLLGDLGRMAPDNHNFVPNAYDINNDGLIVGGAATSQGEFHAFLHNNGVMTDLGTLGGTLSWASAINDAGQVAGRSWLAGDTAVRAFLYSNGVMQDLGTLPGASYSAATAINSYGHVVGHSGSNSFLYQSGTMHDLGPGYAFDINDNGLIVGSVWNSTNDSVIAAFYSNGEWHEIGTLGGSYSEAFAVNNHGQVVGISEDAAGKQRAFLYDDGTMYDLSSLVEPAPGWAMPFAFDINDRGQIVGDSGYLFTPNPEPSTVALLGLGLVGLLYWGRRRLGRRAAQ